MARLVNYFIGLLVLILSVLSWLVLDLSPEIGFTPQHLFFFSGFAICVGTLLLDKTRSRWIAGLTTATALFFVLGFAPQQHYVFYYAFYMSQFALLVFTLSRADLSPRMKTWIGYALVALVICSFARGSSWFIDDYKILVFVGIAVLFALAPLALPLKTPKATEAAWSAVGLQQAILKFGCIYMLYRFKPYLFNFDLKILVMPVVSAVLVMVAVISIFIRRKGFWDRGIQSIISLFVIGQSALQNEGALPILVLLTTVVSIQHITPSDAVTEGTLWDLIIRPFENAGLGSAAFFSMIVVLAMTRTDMTATEIFLWNGIIVVTAVLSWIKNIHISTAHFEDPGPRGWLKQKIILNLIVIILVLLWTVLIPMSKGGSGV